MATIESNFAKILFNDLKEAYFNPKQHKWRCDTCGTVYDIDEDAYMCCSEVSIVEE